MHEITVETVLSTMEEVVAEFGEDYVYVEPGDPEDDSYGCLYAHEGGPSCLIAHVLTRLDVPLSELAEYEGNSAIYLAEDLLGLSNSVANVLQAAQSEQDTGGTWGEALDYARDVAREIEKESE